MKKPLPLLTIFLIIFLDLVGFGIVIPILPYYAQKFGASGFLIGWLMTSYSLMQFLVAPLWGQWSDRVGRRPILLLSVAGTALSFVLLGFADSLWVLFLGRVLAGIFGANISTAYAYVSDVTTEENRARGMGLIGAGFGLGFIFGPAIGGTLSQWGYAAPMFAAAGLGLINFIFAVFFLKEPSTSTQERKKNRTPLSLKNVQKVFSFPICARSIPLFFLVTFAWAQMEVVFAIFMKDRFSYTAQDAGYVLAVMGVIAVIIQGGLIGRLAKRFGERTLIDFGLILCGVALLLFGRSFELSLSFLALTAMAIGHAVLHPSLSSLTSQGAPKNARGLTMGVFHSAGSLARVLAPPLAGFSFDHWGTGSPLYLSGLILFLALGLSLIWKPKTR